MAVGFSLGAVLCVFHLFLYWDFRVFYVFLLSIFPEMLNEAKHLRPGRGQNIVAEAEARFKEAKQNCVLIEYLT